MADYERAELLLPSGRPFGYGTDRSLSSVRDLYYKTREEGDPEFKVGAPSKKLRAILSGSSQEVIEATLQKKYPWAGKVVTSRGVEGAEDGEVYNLYLDPETNTIFSVDEPGTTWGDVADVTRDIVTIGGEIGTEALMAARGKKKPGGTGVINKIKDIGKRGAGVATGGTAADIMYSKAMDVFGGLEDPTVAGKSVEQLTKEWTARFFGEALIGGPLSMLGRGGAKRTARGGMPREEFAGKLDKYRKGMGDEPPSMGAFTGPDSRVQAVEDKIIQFYPEHGGRELSGAVRQADEAVERRINEIVGDNMGEGAVGSPFEAGTRARQAIEGEKVPYGSVKEAEGAPGTFEAIPGTKRTRQGGWYEVAQTNLGEMRDRVRADLPVDTRLYAPPETPAVLQGAPGAPGQASSSILSGRGPKGSKGPQAMPKGGAQPGTASAVVSPYTVKNAGDLPINRTYNAIMARGGPQTAELKALGEIVNSPTSTVGDLLDLQSRLGPGGAGIQGVSPDDGTKMYASIKETLRSMLKDNPEALQRQMAFDRQAEEFYAQVNNQMNKIFKRAKGVDANPEQAFSRLMSGMTGVGNKEMLEDVFTKMDPDDADFIKQAMLDRFFNTTKPSTALNKWEKMPLEVKDIMAPPNTYIRTSLDDLYDTAFDLRIFDRKGGAAATLTKDQQGTVNRAMRYAGAGAIVTPMALAQFGISGAPSMASVGLGAGLITTAFIQSVADNFIKAGKSELLRSPAFYDWAASATKALPGAGAGDKWGREQAINFAASIVPRIGAEVKNMSLQDMRDMKAIQEEYLAVFEEALGAQENPPVGGGVLGNNFQDSVPGPAGAQQRILGILGIGR